MTEAFYSSEFRSVMGSVKVDDPKKNIVEVTVCPYGVVDEYSTRWMPGVFTKSLERRVPPMVWAHNWNDPIGHPIDKDDNAQRLRTVFQLDDFDAVPRAKQAFAQISSGTIQDTSFGFKLIRDEPAPGETGVFNQCEARLDEVSPVLLGAVPGAGITGVRGIPASEVMRLARGLEAGDISLEAALAAVMAVASDDTRQMHSHARKVGGGIVNHSHMYKDTDGMHAHSDLMPAVKLGRSEPEGDTRIDGVAADGSAGVGPDDVCPNCGKPVPDGALFCPFCGWSLTDNESDDAARGARELLTELSMRSL